MRYSHDIGAELNGIVRTLGVFKLALAVLIFACS